MLTKWGFKNMASTIVTLLFLLLYVYAEHPQLQVENALVSKPA